MVVTKTELKKKKTHIHQATTKHDWQTIWVKSYSHFQGYELIWGQPVRGRDSWVKQLLERFVSMMYMFVAVSTFVSVKPYTILKRRHGDNFQPSLWQQNQVGLSGKPLFWAQFNISTPKITKHFWGDVKFQPCLGLLSLKTNPTINTALSQRATINIIKSQHNPG